MINPNSDNSHQPFTMTGIAGSSGIAVGKAFLFSHEDFWIEERKIDPGQIEHEKRRLRIAMDAVVEDIQRLKIQIEERAGTENGQIFEPYIMLLQDPLLFDEASGLIEDGINAEYAFFRATRKIIKAYKKVDDEYLRERINDIKDIMRRVYVKLTGESHFVQFRFDEPVIVVAPNLSPSDTVNMESGNIIAFVTDFGGVTSHVSILARALGIPAVLSLKTATQDISNDDTLVVDGMHGTVYVNPGQSLIDRYITRREEYFRRRASFNELRDLPAQTTDGTRINLMANIEFYHEVDTIVSNGAEGIGLYRSEYHYIVNDRAPTEDEQFTAYFKVAERMMPNPVIIRTCDLGGDKISHIIQTEREDNPYLGWRAIRVSLAMTDMFRIQLKAIVRASALRNVRILFPMISGVDELDDALCLLDEVKEEVRSEGHDYNPDMQVGVMIEVPSAVVIAGHLAERCDFFSIGTNDLIQYTVAVDRSNDRIANLFDPFHPGVLRLINMTVDAAKSGGIPVAVCGEMGGDPMTALILIGLGIRELSMTAVQIPVLKSMIRKISIDMMEQLAKESLSLATGIEVRRLIEQRCREWNIDLSI